MAQLTSPVPKSMGASASVAIPKGALSWAFVLLTGTGTIGGESAPLGVPLSGDALAADLVVTTDADSSGFVLWEGMA